MMSILDYVPTQYKIGAIAGVVVIVASTIGWLLIARANLRAELAEAQAGRQVCLAANADFQEKTETQNRAIAQLQAEAEARAESVKQAVDASKAVARPHAARAASIERLVPSSGDCEATAKLLADYFTGRAQ
jgi:hypothetical protein